jgi:hypothetical protein
VESKGYDRVKVRIMIELANGSSYAFPAAQVQYMQNASAAWSTLPDAQE